MRHLNCTLPAHKRTLRRVAGYLLVALLAAAALGPAAPRAQAQAASLFEAESFADASAPTESTAWGDVDNDGDLDLAVGNEGQPSRLYRNAGGALVPAGDLWSPLPDDPVRSLAWGDMDNDGDLDLAVGNYGRPNRLYRNSGGTLTLDLGWAPLARRTTSLAWGDIDHNGTLDLAVGNDRQPLQVYLNTNGVLAQAAILPTDQKDRTSSVAWGDFNGDGWLDLVVGNYFDQPSRLYLNQQGALTLNTSAWAPPANETTRDVAWGDYDSDGDLDLAVANGGVEAGERPNRLYINEQSRLVLDRAWSPPSAPTNSIAWGDYDNDGDLDLATGNGNGVWLDQNRIYRTTNRQLESVPIWTSAQTGLTNSVAWADYDGDGDLDLTTGNDGLANVLYRNTHSTLEAGADSRLPAAPARSLAWGDLDNDGDLDLAVGNGAANGRTSQLYRNNQGSLQIDQGWAPEPADTWSLAWGDVDNDGDLDLATGNGGDNGDPGQPNRLYRNVGGALQLDQSWAPPADRTRSLAWGDVDNDGDLDLAVGNRGQPSRVYYNLDGQLEQTASWASAYSDDTTSLAWGDYDGDGDLDLAIGNGGATDDAAQPNRLYRNQNGVLQLDQSWAPPANRTRSLAWGDVDNDGDLDLAIGNIRRPAQVYRNTNGRLEGQASWESVDAAVSTSVAWGDYDGDGELDLAVANNDQPSRLYRNLNGRLENHAIWESDRIVTTTNLAWGDVDADGDLDLALSNSGQASQIYRNTRDAQASRSAVPRIRIIRPAPLADANFYSTPTIWPGPTIPFTYTLTHPQSLAARQVIGQYSLDGGGQWFSAVAATGTPTTTLSSSPTGTVHTYTWDVYRSGMMGKSDNIVFRLIALPSIATEPNQAPGPYQHAAFTSNTFPFRVRGTQVRVLRGGAPTEGAQVFRLRSGAVAGAQPLANNGQAAHTDRLGYLQGRGQLAPGDSIAAVLPISATETYTLYLTSARPIASGLAMQPVALTGVQTLAVAPDNPLMLFNLDVSLEWDARADKQFLAQLDFDLRRASDFLYDWTNGQAALGRIRVYHDKQRWNDAHIRIFATNRLRPNANQGGIATQVITDPVSLGAGDSSAPIAYAPGQIHMGAVWNRYGEASGNLGQDWPRALAHELGHFALFLDDNYLGLDSNRLLVPVEGCAGAMTDPYRDDYSEFHPDADWERDCRSTLSAQTTGRSDWATITAFYDHPELGFKLNHPPAFNANPGPSGMPLDVTTVDFIEPATPARGLDEPVFYMTQDGGHSQPSPRARAFLFRNDRIIDLGSPTLDYVRAPGAAAGDRLCVYDLAAARQDGQPDPRLGCETISAGDEQLELVRQPQWQPDLLVTPVTSRTIELSVTGVLGTATLPGAPSPALAARLYPSYVGFGSPISYTIALTPTSSGDYAGAFQLDLKQPSFEGYVHVWVDEAAPRREVVADYTLGGNPGNARSRDTPRGNPGNARSRDTPVLSSDGQMLLFGKDLSFAPGTFFSIQTVMNLPELPPWATVVGQGYRLSASAGAPDFHGTSLSFSYLGREVPPGEEQWLTLYYRDTATAGCQPQPAPCWRPLTTARDTRHNIASVETQGPGLYALMSSVEIPLAQGANVVAYPIHTRRTVQDALRSIAGLYTMVQSYNPQRDGWQELGPDDWLEFGKGYKITASADTIWRLKGDGAGSAPEHDARAAPAIATGALPASAGLSAALGSPVVARVDGKTCGQGSARQDGPQIVYTVAVASEAAGMPGCGAPGRAVTFEIGSQRIASTTWDRIVAGKERL